MTLNEVWSTAFFQWRSLGPQSVWALVAVGMFQTYFRRSNIHAMSIKLNSTS